MKGLPRPLLPFRVQALVSLLFAGLLGIYGLETLALVFLLLEAYALHLRFSPQALSWLLLWAGVVACCSWAALGLLKRRRFWLAFGGWAPGPSRSPVWKAARAAFLAGDLEKALALLQRHLNEAPQDSPEAARFNRAGLLALLGRRPEALESMEPGSRRARILGGRHEGGLALPLALVLFLALPAVALHVRAMIPRLKVLGSGFQDGDFLASQTGHFVLHYHDAAYRDWAARTAEAALAFDLAFYGMPADSFSVSKIRLYLCDSQAEYLARSPFAQSWEAGSAQPGRRSIYLYRDPSPSLYDDVVMAHEVSHICFHQLFPDKEDLSRRNSGWWGAWGDDLRLMGGLDREPLPSWLDEGLANYLGYRFALETRTRVDYRLWLEANVFKELEKRHYPFELFWSANPQALHGQVDDIQLFYTQGFSLVFTLVEHFGRERFLRFLREYYLLHDLGKALAKSYPQIQSAEDLRGIWLLYAGAGGS